MNKEIQKLLLGDLQEATHAGGGVGVGVDG